MENNNIQVEVRKVIFDVIKDRNCMNIEDVSLMDTRMEDMRIEAVDLKDIIRALEEKFQVRFKARDITFSATVKNISDYILFKRETIKKKAEEMKEIEKRIFQGH